MLYKVYNGLLALALLPISLSLPADSGVGGNQLQRRALEYEYRRDSQSHQCTLHALGGTQDDSDNIANAVQQCGTNGVITLPDPV